MQLRTRSSHGDAGKAKVLFGHGYKVFIKGSDLGGDAAGRRQCHFVGPRAFSNDGMRRHPELVARLAVQIVHLVAHLQSVHLVAPRRDVARPVQFLGVDRVLHDPTVGLVRELPANEDGIFAHSERLDGSRSARDVLLSQGGYFLAGDAVSPVRKGANLNRVVGKLAQSRQFGTRILRDPVGSSSWIVPGQRRSIDNLVASDDTVGRVLRRCRPAHLRTRSQSCSTCVF